MPVTIRSDHVVVNLMNLKRCRGLYRVFVIFLRQVHPILNHVLAYLEVILEGETLEVVGDVELHNAQVADLLGKIFLRIHLRMGNGVVSYDDGGKLCNIM